MATRTIPSEDQILSWYHTLTNWGRWGADDERGTLNLITPQPSGYRQPVSSAKAY